MGIIISNLFNIIDGIIAIAIVAIFVKYRGTLWNHLKKARVKTVVGLISIIIGFIFIVYGNSTYHLAITGISPTNSWSYYWNTLWKLTLFDAIGVVLIFLGGFLINPQATARIVHHMAENIMRED